MDKDILRYSENGIKREIVSLKKNLSYLNEKKLSQGLSTYDAKIYDYKKKKLKRLELILK